MSTPSVFDQLVGQSHITEILQGAVKAAQGGQESADLSHEIKVPKLKKSIKASIKKPVKKSAKKK